LYSLQEQIRQKTVSQTKGEVMTRYILCKPCGLKFKLDPEDVETGWHLRKVTGVGQKPADHAIKVNDRRIDIPSLLCDHCNDELPNGSAVIAVTMWRGAEPGTWETEYLAA
jgi:hypothetical protein